MKAKPNDIQRIEHMIAAIETIFEYTENISKEIFCKGGIILDAVIKNFQVLGEAAYHITKTTQQYHQQIPWKKIAGLRHVLVHDYYEINPEILWNVKEDFLPNLQIELTQLLNKEVD